MYTANLKFIAPEQVDMQCISFWSRISLCSGLRVRKNASGSGGKGFRVKDIAVDRPLHDPPGRALQKQGGEQTIGTKQIEPLLGRSATLVLFQIGRLSIGPTMILRLLASGIIPGGSCQDKSLGRPKPALQLSASSS